MLGENDNSFVSVSPSNSSPLEEFAKKIFNKMLSENVPPIPYYYNIYFLNELDNESEEFKKHVYEMMSIEESSEVEKEIEIEKKLKYSFKYSKELLQKIAILYKNIQTLKSLLQKYIKENSHITNSKMFERILLSLEDNLQKVSSKFDRELSEIKELYSKNIEILKEIETSSVYDARYGVYNKNYFLKELKKEIMLSKKFKHPSSVITIKIKDKILKSLKSEKSKIMLSRSLAKIMLKTSRRTDIVAHIENGIFAMLLKSTDRVGAYKTVERLGDVVSLSTIFLEGEEISTEIVAGICEFNENYTEEVCLSNAFKAMEVAQKEDMLYHIYEGEK